MAQNPEFDFQTSCLDFKTRGVNIYKRSLWTDCSFDIDGVIVEAHKLILSMSSPVFAKMFYGDTKVNNFYKIKIFDTSDEVFKAMMKYIYTDKLSLIGISMCKQMYVASVKYKLPYITAKCVDYLDKHMNTTCVYDAYDFGIANGDKKVIEIASQFFRKNTEKCLNDDSFINADPSTIAHMFSLEGLNLPSELELLKGAEIYNTVLKRKESQQLAYKLNNAEKDDLSISTMYSSSDNTSKTPNGKKEPRSEKHPMREILSQIRFLNLTCKEFAMVSAHTTLLTMDEALAIFINLSDPQTDIHMPEGFSTSRERRTTNANLPPSSSSYLYRKSLKETIRLCSAVVRPR